MRKRERVKRTSAKTRCPHVTVPQKTEGRTFTTNEILIVSKYRFVKWTRFNLDFELLNTVSEVARRLQIN